MSNSLPDGWANQKLGAIVEPDAPIIYGILQPGPHIADGVPYVRPTEIVEDQIAVASLRRTAPSIAQRYARSTLRGGDVLLSIVGTIGKVAIVPRELDGANITQSSCRIRPESGVITNNIIAWFLRSPLAGREFNRVRLGTGVPRLNLAHVREIPIPLPPLNEQQRIVAKIEALMARTERAEEALRQAGVRDFAGKFLLLRQSILAKAFRGELVPQDPNDEPASELLARIKAERTATGTPSRRGGRPKRAAAPVA